MKLTSLEICAGAGGQAIGLEQAGFEHLALVEIDKSACVTLRHNRPLWNVVETDVRCFSACGYPEVDLFSGGVPCPPFSIAGKQLGAMDERDLFPEALRIARECRPKAILLENVRGILDKKFLSYRKEIITELKKMGYRCDWRLVNAFDFGVSQVRARAILIALKEDYFPYFAWPEKQSPPPSVGELLIEAMGSQGWEKATTWAEKANGVAPTLVGGSKKHGGADLGPTRAKQAWAKLGVDGAGIAELAPAADFDGTPRLTLKMAALVQGFPPAWEILGKKTPAYRQIGNAFPPPVAKAIGLSIKNAILRYERQSEKEARRQSQTA